MSDHDCPHCAEARAMADELRQALPDIHAVRPLLKEAREIIAQLRKLAPQDGHHVDATPLPAEAAPGTSATVRKSRDHA